MRDPGFDSWLNLSLDGLWTQSAKFEIKVTKHIYFFPQNY